MKRMLLTGKIVQDLTSGDYRKLRISNNVTRWIAFLPTTGKFATTHTQVLNGGNIKCWVVEKEDPQGISYYEVDQLVLT